MIKQEINKEFIDHLRLSTGITYWLFNESEKSEILPKEQTHQSLLDNFIVDENIYWYYHLPTSKLLSETEYQEMKNMGFVGRRETALFPYSNIIYGAYFSRIDLIYKLERIAFSHETYKINGNKIRNFEDLQPYFKEYAKGFQNGFNEFDNSQIKPFLTMLADKQDYVNKVFEFITNYIFLKYSWLQQSSIVTNQDNEIINAFEHGQLQGYFYKAWSIVFSNNNLFAPLFQEYFNDLSTQPIKTKADILKEQLSQYGFFELEKVKILSGQNKVSIIEKIAESGLPYAIAMFDYLQFISYLEKKHFDSKYKLNREVSKWFDSDKEGRAVKGNISSLLKNTTENKDRYTAYKHKENVIKDYEQLK